MASASRNDNAFGKLKGKSKISKLLSGILKDTKEKSSQVQIALEEHMEEVADKEGGTFDIDEMTITFGNPEESVIVYGSLESLDKVENFVFQALYRSNNPTIFVTGSSSCSIEEAIHNLANK